MTTHAPGTAAPPTPAGPVVLPGTPVVPGVAWGPVVRPSGTVLLPSDDGAVVAEEERAGEKERFEAAAGVVADRLSQRAAAATGVSAEVLSTTAGLARDRGLLMAVGQRIDAGVSAPVATVESAQQFVDMFAALGGLMAERVTDVRDVRDRIVAELTGQGEPGVPRPEVPSVLLAEDLAPADTAGLDPTRVVGLATRLGGTTSHTVTVHPDEAEAQARVAAARAAAEALAGYEGPAQTRDGHAVQVLANVQDGA